MIITWMYLRYVALVADTYKRIPLHYGSRRLSGNFTSAGGEITS